MYERAINPETSFGISTIYALSDFGKINFMAMPFYRVFFGSKKSNCGLFIETNTSYIISEDHDFYLPYSTTPSFSTGEPYHNIGIGAAVGYKFLNQKNWILEFLAGAGRSLTSKEIVLYSYPRAGVYIGKRF